MAIRLYLDDRKNKEEAQIKASVSHRGENALVPLGIYIRTDQWDKSSREVVNHPRKKEVNASLARLKADLELELLRIRERLPFAELRRRLAAVIDPDADAEPGFVARYEHFLSLKTAPKTVKGYRWTLKALEEFDPGLDRRSFEDIGVDYLKDFVAWCTRNGLNRNSCNIHLRYIRAVFNDAIDAGITTSYPFRAVKVKPLPVRKKALTPDQLRVLFSFPCEPWQVEYREMFKLMFFLRGINAVDLFKATLSQVVNGRLEYRRSKVGTLFSVKIEPEARQIIDRYKGENHLLSPLDRYRDYEDYLHHMNDALKTIGRPLGKRGKVMGEGMFPELSSNWARHSWATAGISLDIPKETISRGMGHSNGIRVTDTYIDFDMRKVDEANRRIIDLILYR